jgi:dUTP pyrophosphatase
VPNNGTVTLLNNQAATAVDTGIAIGLPPNTYGRIAERSGRALMQNLRVGGGVIDSDYTGEIRVILTNHGAQPIVIQHGDRIAQLIIEVITTPAVEEVTQEDLNQAANALSSRGQAGFGSTGQ